MKIESESYPPILQLEIDVISGSINLLIVVRLFLETASQLAYFPIPRGLIIEIPVTTTFLLAPRADMIN